MRNEIYQFWRLFMLWAGLIAIFRVVFWPITSSSLFAFPFLLVAIIIYIVIEISYIISKGKIWRNKAPDSFLMNIVDNFAMACTSFVGSFWLTNGVKQISKLTLADWQQIGNGCILVAIIASVVFIKWIIWKSIGGRKRK